MKKLVLIGLVFATLACFSVEETITLNADGSGTYEVEILVPAGNDALIAPAVDSLMKDLGLGSPDRTVRGDTVSYTAERPFGSSDELSSLTRDGITVSMEDETLSFRYAVSGSSAPGEEGIVLEGFHRILRLRVPGQVLESNADEIRGQTLSWSRDLSQSFVAEAKAKVGKSGVSPGALIGLIVALALVLFLLSRFGRRPRA
jgi:hypothetical protein